MSDFGSAHIFSRDGKKLYRIGKGLFGLSLQVYERVKLEGEHYTYEDKNRDKVMVFKSYEDAYDKVMELLSE